MREEEGALGTHTHIVRTYTHRKKGREKPFLLWGKGEEEEKGDFVLIRPR